MTETSKMPFEPIPMPGMPEMPKPSFSRSTTPPAAPPITRKPLMIADDKPDSFFLPNGIAPEAPKSPPTMTAEVKPSGFPLNWLKPSRAKGVVIAGLGSLAIGAFGLNAFVPVPVSEPIKANTFADTASVQPIKPKPWVEEQRDDKLPGLLPPLAPISSDNLLDKPLPLPGEFTQVGAIAPEAKAVPVLPPTGLPALPTGLPLVPITQTDPLPVPLIPGLGSEPKPLGAAPLVPPALPGLPGPMLSEPTKEVLPLPTLGREPAMTPGSPTAVPLPLPKVDLAPLVIAPPKPLLPLPGLVPAPLETQKPSIELKPFPPAPAPYSPTPVPSELVKRVTTAPTETKTDYDVDIHKIRAGDTYATISQRYYETANFANQLRAYNENADLSRAPDVQVPPLYVIKKFGTGRGADSTGVVPAGVIQVPAPLAPAEVQWGTPDARKNGTSGKSNNGEPNWR